LLLHPVTDYLCQAVGDSDVICGNAARAILGSVSHDVTYQYL
jgi:hypothetical protein